MLADFLKRRENEARNPQTVVQLKEARKAIEEKDAVIAEKEDLIAKQQQEIKDLRDRLGIDRFPSRMQA